VFGYSSGSFAFAAARVADAYRWVAQHVWRERRSNSAIDTRPSASRRHSSDIELLVEPSHAIDTITPPRHGHARLDAAALAALEVDALVAIDRFDALLGGRLTVQRDASSVIVQGLVDDSQRRQIRALLRSLPHADALRLDMRTLDEAVRGTPPASGIARFQPLSFDPDSIPVAAELRAYVAAPALDIDAEVRRLANDGLRRSREALVHALAIESVAERFDDEALQALNRDAHGKWRALIGKHAAAVAADLQRLRRALEPALSPRTAAEPDARDDQAAPADIRAAVRDLGSRAVRIDDGVRAALAASSEPPEEIKLRDPAFWRAVRYAESLAQRLAR
jgi:hypothetical protein